MTAPYLLGIDSGTSVVKSVVFDLAGNEIAVARRETPVLTPVPNGAEMDMNLAWRLASETVTEVVAAVGGGDKIAGVGVSGTCCGLWLVDAAGNPARAALLWNDGRAADIIQRWDSDGFLDRVWELTGNAMFPGYRLVALRWLLEHEPETFERARWVLFHKDWLRYKLTGVIGSDESDVGYFPGDLSARGYSEPLLDEAGLSAWRDKLPPVFPSQAVAGEITPEAATQTGLRAGTPVVAGAVDVIASVLGGGAYRAGQAVSILGTSFLNTLVSDQPTYEPKRAGVQTCMPEGKWGRSLINTSGTISIEWMIKTLAEPERQQAAATGQSVYELVEQQVTQVPPGAHGIVFLPYLNSTGIISPFNAPHARGEFFGLTLDHTRFDLMRAVYEGIALAMRDCYSVIERPVEEVVLVGGGARSGFWAQMMADATGKRILIPGGTEFGARGGAILAGVGVGIFGSFDEAMAAFIRPDRAYEPHPEYADVYAALYDLYRHLYLNAREAWELRARALGKLPM
jgi:sugar (pentulose or hexulose) kinase